jgi:hypothetical protein
LEVQPDIAKAPIKVTRKTHESHLQRNIASFGVILVFQDKRCEPEINWSFSSFCEASWY